MAKRSRSLHSVIEASAIISGSFLSGAMMGLSLVAVPVLLDTSTEASQLLTQFVQLYEYGHKLMPSLAVATFVLFGHTAIHKRASEQPWLRHVAAGITTLSIVPFTWIVMMPTNNDLFQLHTESKTASGAVALSEVQALLVRWTRLHIVRSLFPLLGALIGGRDILKELSAF